MREVRWGAVGFVAGGALWIGNGLLGLSAENGSSGFYVSELVWLPVHVLIGIGIWALLRSDVTAGDEVRRGLRIALVGRAVFFVAELVSMAVQNDEVFLLPLAAVTTAIGMTIAGVGIIRSHEWTSWRRFTALAMGVYPFVAMFPLVAITGKRPDLEMSLWGLTFIALGVAYAQEAVGARATSRTEPVPAA